MVSALNGNESKVVVFAEQRFALSQTSCPLKVKAVGTCVNLSIQHDLVHTTQGALPSQITKYVSQDLVAM